MSFITIGFAQMIHVFNIRSNHSIFAHNPFNNYYVDLAVIGSILLLSLVSFIVPIAEVFDMEQISTNLYLIALAMAFIPIPFVEIMKITEKLIIKNKANKNHISLLKNN